MMAADFARFETVVRRMEKLFGKKIDDESMQSYWRALKDQSLQQFERMADKHERYGRFFPKPAELRPKDDAGVAVVRSGKMEAEFKEGEALCVRNLQDIGEGCEEWVHEVRLRRADRLMATVHESDPTYPIIKREWLTLRGLP